MYLCLGGCCFYWEQPLLMSWVSSERRTWGSSFSSSRQLSQSQAWVVVKETYLWHTSSPWFLLLVCFSIAMETITNSFSNSQCPTRNVYFITHSSEQGVLFNFWLLTCMSSLALPGTVCAEPRWADTAQLWVQGYTKVSSVGMVWKLR